MDERDDAAPAAAGADAPAPPAPESPWRVILPYAGLLAYIWTPAEVRDTPLGLFLPSIGAAVLIVSIVKRPRLAEAGVGVRHLARASAASAALLAVALVPCLVVWHRSGARLQPDLARNMLLYPFWGIAQQAFFQGYVHVRLRDTTGERAAAYLAALLFGVCHLGNLPLAAVTLAAGLAFSTIFRWAPSVWPLGVAHGALGVVLDSLFDWNLRVGIDGWRTEWW